MYRNIIQQARRVGLLVGWGILQACTAQENSRPDNLIPEEKMADILTEIHLAEARVSRLSLTAIDSSNVVYKHLERQIFQKLKVDTAAYTKSYIFYSSHPSEMEAVYKRVTEKLKKKTETPSKPTKS